MGVCNGSLRKDRSCVSHCFSSKANPLWFDKMKLTLMLLSLTCLYVCALVAFVQASGNDTCNMCRMGFSALQRHVTNNNAHAIEDGFDSICSHFPETLAEVCKKLGHTDGRQLAKKIEAMTADQFCVPTGMCKLRGANDFHDCNKCVDEIKFLRPSLTKEPFGRPARKYLDDTFCKHYKKKEMQDDCRDWSGRFIAYGQTSVDHLTDKALCASLSIRYC